MKIVIWTGPAWETWGPASLLTGLGGSEIAAIHMARELALRGHEVEVIGQVTPEIWQGAKFTDFREYVDITCLGRTNLSMPKKTDMQIECDAFVSSRDLFALRILQPKARMTALWMHDIHVGPDPQGFLGEYNMILTLSEWARERARRYYPKVPGDRFILTRNGIDTSLFNIIPKKTGRKVIYSSSPDRGLDRLLDYWPSICKIIPEAELHIYYGFNTWERMAELHRDQGAKHQIEYYRFRMAKLADQGVVSHGRVGQRELADAYLGASMWLYPTNFHETSCISAMEAQAASVFCVCSKLAALPETAKFAYFVDPPNTRGGYRAEFLEHVERAARLTRTCGFATDGLVDRMEEEREWALCELGWGGVAQQWEELFHAYPADNPE